MTLNRMGTTRDVVLIGRWALKFPTVREWRLFLCGLLGNIQESRFSELQWPGVCPVTFSLPLGFLVVMPRVRMMTDEEFQSFDWSGWLPDEVGDLAESKPDSFGWLGERLVVIDYGGYRQLPPGKCQTGWKAETK